MLQDDYTWRRMCLVRFGTTELPDDCQSFRKLYMKLAANLLSIADFDIVWLNDLYWQIVVDDDDEEEEGESIFGRFARLH